MDTARTYSQPTRRPTCSTAIAAGGTPVKVVEEDEEMGTNANLRAIGLGALSGLRSMGPSALLTRELGRRRRGTRGRGRGLALLAVGEALADKLPFAPSRTRVPSLLARIAAGAWVGARVAGRGHPLLGPVFLGATAAVAATHAAIRLREAAAHRSKAVGCAVALAEDALVFWGSRRLASAVPSRR